MITIDFEKLNEEGFVLIKNVLPNHLLEKIRVKLVESFEQHKKIQVKNKNEINTYGVSLHVLLNDIIFFELLEYLIKIEFLKKLEENFFKSKCILNSFSGLNNIKSFPNFLA